MKNGSRGDLRWPPEIRSAAWTDLEPVVRLMTQLAQGTGYSLERGFRGDWPGARLVRKLMFGAREIRILLNPRSIEDGRIAYYLEVVEYRSFLLWGYTTRFDDLGELSPSDLKNTDELRSRIEPLIIG